jgi:hypothetical protein
MQQNLTRVTVFDRGRSKVALFLLLKQKYIFTAHWGKRYVTVDIFAPKFRQ